MSKLVFWWKNGVLQVENILHGFEGGTVSCKLKISFMEFEGGTVLGERTQRDSSPAESEPGLAPS